MKKNICKICSNKTKSKKVTTRSKKKTKIFICKICDFEFFSYDPRKNLERNKLDVSRLKKAGLKISDLDLVESNEAFAAQACAVNKQLGLNPEIVNVNGGAIALGHPVGATGAIIITKLVYELRKRKGKFGLATMCIGGGQGIAVIIEALWFYMSYKRISIEDAQKFIETDKITLIDIRDLNSFTSGHIKNAIHI